MSTMRPNVLRSIAKGMKRSVVVAVRPTSVHSLARQTWSDSRQQCLVAPRHIRCYATPAPHVNESHLSMEEYHNISDGTMDQLLERLENLLDNFGDDSYEVEYHSGVLTLKVGEHGTYVINKQPPNKQIWLSSPFSGPKRYDYSEELDDWIYLRDGRAMGDLLNSELSEVFKQKVNLQLDHVSEIV